MQASLGQIWPSQVLSRGTQKKNEKKKHVTETIRFVIVMKTWKKHFSDHI